ncbi:MAG: hypothetical protein QMC95_00680 [Desulfitobacteriaceae bacterium]|nr:hypothetical protein [Desulfitobacteriaceae bacterium]MDI6880209.1 hypothetical protein [Desulfitobacteriaceae bacterium]MDI6912716.1 hypothetical protein [Desulfitobacteriaceae bacterium]
MRFSQLRVVFALDDSIDDCGFPSREFELIIGRELFLIAKLYENDELGVLAISGIALEKDFYLHVAIGSFQPGCTIERIAIIVIHRIVQNVSTQLLNVIEQAGIEHSMDL